MVCKRARDPKKRRPSMQPYCEDSDNSLVEQLFPTKSREEVRKELEEIRPKIPEAKYIIQDSQQKFKLFTAESKTGNERQAQLTNKLRKVVMQTDLLRKKFKKQKEK